VKSEEFEHVLAAAAAVTGEEEFVVVGSQAILGSVASPPPELLTSMEADIYPLRTPEVAIQIAGSLGDGSSFHNSFGYHAHGVGPLTAKPPSLSTASCVFSQPSRSGRGRGAQYGAEQQHVQRPRRAVDPYQDLGLGAASGQTTFIACGYLAMTVLARGCAYAGRGLRRGARIVIIALYPAFAAVLLLGAWPADRCWLQAGRLGELREGG